MLLVNGGYLHCTDLVNSSLKGTKKMDRVISKTQVSDPGPSWPSCSSLLPVPYLSDAPRRRSIITGDSARIQDGTTENSVWFFNVLGVQHRHMGPQFNISSERLLVIFKLAGWGPETLCSRVLSSTY